MSEPLPLQKAQNIDDVSDLTAKAADVPFPIGKSELARPDKATKKEYFVSQIASARYSASGDTLRVRYPSKVYCLRVLRGLFFSLIRMLLFSRFPETAI